MARSFDGVDDYLIGLGLAGLLPTGPMTIGFFIRARVVNQAMTYVQLLDDTASVGLRYGLHFHARFAGAYWNWQGANTDGADGSGDFGDSVEVSASYVLVLAESDDTGPDNAWFLGATQQGTRDTAFNRRVFATGNTGDVIVGAGAPGSPVNFADCDVGELFVLDYFLSGGEKTTLAAGGNCAALTTPPIYYWRLLGDASPEPEHYGGPSLTVVGAVQTDHPSVDAPPSGGTTENVASDIITPTDLSATVTVKQKYQIASSIVSPTDLSASVSAVAQIASSIVSPTDLSGTVSVVVQVASSIVSPTDLSAALAVKQGVQAAIVSTTSLSGTVDASVTVSVFASMVSPTSVGGDQDTIVYALTQFVSATGLSATADVIISDIQQVSAASVSATSLSGAVNVKQRFQVASSIVSATDVTADVKQTIQVSSSITSVTDVIGSVSINGRVNVSTRAVSSTNVSGAVRATASVSAGMISSSNMSGSIVIAPMVVQASVRIVSSTNMLADEGSTPPSIVFDPDLEDAEIILSMFQVHTQARSARIGRGNIITIQFTLDFDRNGGGT